MKKDAVIKLVRVAEDESKVWGADASMPKKRIAAKICALKIKE